MGGVNQNALSIGFSILMDLYQAAAEQVLEDESPTDFLKEFCLDIPPEEIIPVKKRKAVLWWTEVVSRSCWQRFEACREITMLNEKKCLQM
jgi:hypothetical protein